MKYQIYKITNRIDGKLYIGKHVCRHAKCEYMGSGKQLHRAFTKYGQKNFSKEILFEFETEEEMNAKERELVTEEFCNRPDTYNLCPGGKGGFGYVNMNNLNLYGANRDNALKALDTGRFNLKALMCDESFRSEHSEATKRGVHSYYENGGTNGFKGKKHSPKTRQKMKQHVGKQAGSKNSQFGTCWVTNGRVAKKIDKSELLEYLDIRGWSRGRKTDL